MYTRLPTHLAGAGDAVTRDADRAVLPRDPGNADWLAYADWLAQGNVPADPPADPVPPRTIEGRLLVKALTDGQAGRLKLRDLLRIAGDRAVPETNGAVARAAATLGLDVGAWFDAGAAGA